jgi:hypothetical protein
MSGIRKKLRSSSSVKTETDGDAWMSDDPHEVKVLGRSIIISASSATWSNMKVSSYYSVSAFRGMAV